MDTWDFFYLLTNRNQRKPFSAPNCSNNRKNWRWKRIITKKKKKEKKRVVATSRMEDDDDEEKEGWRKEG